ncbi:hypothetical protein V6Z12_D08G178400 [Gossypium hirsutum]
MMLGRFRLYFLSQGKLSNPSRCHSACLQY